MSPLLDSVSSSAYGMAVKGSDVATQEGPVAAGTRSPSWTSCIQLQQRSSGKPGNGDEWGAGRPLGFWWLWGHQGAFGKCAVSDTS